MRSNAKDLGNIGLKKIIGIETTTLTKIEREVEKYSRRNDLNIVDLSKYDQSLIQKMVIKNYSDLGSKCIKGKCDYDGFMGISINHKYFMKKEIMKYFLAWGSFTFRTFHILLMDDPDRFNFFTFRNNEFNTIESALEHSRKIGAERKSSYEKIINGMGLDNIIIHSFKDFSEDLKFKNIKEIISNAVSSSSDDFNKDFYEDLISLMYHGIGAKINEELLVDDIVLSDALSKINMLLGYIIEELASIIYFTEVLNIKVEIDPTIEFITKSRLYEGIYPKLSNKLNLSKRGHIYIYPQNYKKNTY